MGPWLASCGSFGQVQMCGGHVGGDRRQSWPFELIWKLILALKVPMDGHLKVLSVKPEKKTPEKPEKRREKTESEEKKSLPQFGGFLSLFWP